MKRAFIAMMAFAATCMVLQAKNDVPPTEKRIGLSSWESAVEYDEVKVVDESGNVILYDDFSSDNGNWELYGDWKITDGKLVRTKIELRGGLCVCKIPVGDNYDIYVKARRTYGFDGFLIAYDVVDMFNYSWANCGGWDNKEHGIEKTVDGCRYTSTRPMSLCNNGEIKRNTDYDIHVRVRDWDGDLFLNGEQVCSGNSNWPASKLPGLTKNMSKLVPEKMEQGKILYDKAQEFYKQKDYNNTFIYDQKAAKLNYPLACYSLAICYENGYGTKQDEKKAFSWYLKAAQFGVRDAMSEVSYRYAKGIGCYENAELSILWDMKAFISPGEISQYSLGRTASWLARNLIEAQRKTSHHYSKVAYDENTASTLYAIAVTNVNQPTLEDIFEYRLHWWIHEGSWRAQKAYKWTKKYPDAIFAYEYCKWKLKKDTVAPLKESLDLDVSYAFQVLKKEAQSGNRWAQNKLAYYQWTGISHNVPHDRQQAIEYWKQTSYDPDSQDMLIVAKGEGVYNEDIPEEWYKREQHSNELKEAAEKGNVEAVFALAKDFSALVEAARRFPQYNDEWTKKKYARYEQDSKQLFTIYKSIKPQLRSMQYDKLADSEYAAEFVEIYGKRYSFDPDSCLSLAKDIRNYNLIMKAIKMPKRTYYSQNVSLAAGAVGAIFGGLSGAVKKGVVPQFDEKQLNEDRKTFEDGLKACNEMSKDNGFQYWAYFAYDYVKERFYSWREDGNKEVDKYNEACRKYNSGQSILGSFFDNLGGSSSSGGSSSYGSDNTASDNSDSGTSSESVDIENIDVRCKQVDTYDVVTLGTKVEGKGLLFEVDYDYYVKVYYGVPAGMTSKGWCIDSGSFEDMVYLGQFDTAENAALAGYVWKKYHKKRRTGKLD